MKNHGDRVLPVTADQAIAALADWDVLTQALARVGEVEERTGDVVRGGSRWTADGTDDACLAWEFRVLDIDLDDRTVSYEVAGRDSAAHTAFGGRCGVTVSSLDDGRATVQWSHDLRTHGPRDAAGHTAFGQAGDRAVDLFFEAVDTLLTDSPGRVLMVPGLPTVAAPAAERSATGTPNRPGLRLPGASGHVSTTNAAVGGLVAVALGVALWRVLRHPGGGVRKVGE